MPLPANPETLTIAQLCQNLQSATMLEAAGLIQWIREMLQVPLQVVLQGYGTELGGPAFSTGAAIGATGTVEVVGGKAVTTNLATPFVTDSTGALIIRGGRDDATSTQYLLTDRTGILAVAPPVSKMWVQSQQNTGALTPSVTAAAAGAGLRNIILALGITVACGATAMPATLPSLSGVPTSPVWPIACPVNDSRHILVQGPFIGNANASNVLTGPLGVAGSFQSVWMVGYVASFP